MLDDYFIVGIRLKGLKIQLSLMVFGPYSWVFISQPFEIPKTRIKKMYWNSNSFFGSKQDSNLKMRCMTYLYDVFPNVVESLFAKC